MSGSSVVRSDLEGYAPASNLAFNEKVKNLIRGGKVIHHFAFGQSPFPVIDVAVDALKENADQNSYLPVAGIPDLREAIAKFHLKYDDIAVDPNNIVVGPGSKELMFLMFLVFEGDIMIISPSWTTYKPQTLLAHHKAVLIKTDMQKEWRITPELVEEAVSRCKKNSNKLLVFNNPDNPTGTTYTEQQLQELSVVFRKHKIIVLSDEIYARLRYDMNHVSVSKVYPERTILSSGFSKWASAGGWRVGYAVFPPELESIRNAVRSGGSHTYSCCPAPMQYAITKMLGQEEAVEEYIQHTCRIMAAVANYCYRELTDVGVKVIKSTGGYYMMPDFEIIRPKLLERGITTCEEMCGAMLSEASVALMAGGPAFLRPVDELTTRFCYVCFDGGRALKHSRKCGLNTPLPDDFVKEFCTPVHEGVQSVRNWVLKHQ